MKTAYFDCASGISGDMCLGALVDAGLSARRLRAELQKIPLKGYRLTSSRVRRGGFRALKVDVKITGAKAPARRFRDVRTLINKSALSPALKKRGAETFRLLFEAEASVHGDSYDQVHLHELGAVDCVVDIMGTLIALDALKIERVVASPVNLGSGTVSTEHGELPVPAPATAELLRGAPVYSSGVPYELTTPTGAAILRGAGAMFEDMPLMDLNEVGTGAGGRDIPGHPNVLRVLVGESQDAPAADDVVVIETNIDDMDPRLYDYVMDLLLERGALDVFLTPIIMKKSRPAVTLTVLCTEDRRHEVSRTLLSETTTLGLRHWRAARTVLERRSAKVKTRFGSIRVKEARIGGRIKRMPEYEDCARAAKKHGVPLADVIKKAMEDKG